ncbi:hypothetical protein CTAYLR_005908 [Chrysophaeum taylorii]|uniref:Core domain-containing protein n=1 Tax=Chrysophaeum taylorii TaxID=2483200 RepID=A0AAD7UP71_9STRA|nr:hypothetical protein CTAYLR_005882 [Chrysophaeum taylorii]KAJ8614320.1 hypothetical protein CTAYLR_005908 [Chrysophaeum taylorii]
MRCLLSGNRVLTLVALRQAAVQRATLSSQAALADIVVTPSAARRIGQLLNADGEAQRLRLGVDGGGCSGFKYTFTTEPVSQDLGESDFVFERDGQAVVVDDASLEFVKGATVDYKDEMIRSAFVVLNNPQSESACGCGSSFALKNFEENPAID